MNPTHSQSPTSNGTAGHTPGPWKAALPAGYDATPFPVSDAGGFRVAWINAMATSWSDGRAEANARLIAAAPDLLDALELDLLFHSRPFCRQSLDDFKAAGYTGSDSGNEMRQWLNDRKDAAIARATGQGGGE